MSTRNTGWDNVGRSLPAASRWIGAIGAAPQSPATGDSAASHRALEGGPASVRTFRAEAHEVPQVLPLRKGR